MKYHQSLQTFMSHLMRMNRFTCSLWIEQSNWWWSHCILLCIVRKCQCIVFELDPIHNQMPASKRLEYCYRIANYLKVILVSNKMHSMSMLKECQCVNRHAIRRRRARRNQRSWWNRWHRALNLSGIRGFISFKFTCIFEEFAEFISGSVEREEICDGDSLIMIVATGGRGREPKEWPSDIESISSWGFWDDAGTSEMHEFDFKTSISFHVKYWVVA